MGSDFIEQYRKKSLLTLLLLIFRGRAKYVTMALLMAAASLPFAAGSSLFSRIFGLPPVAAAFRMMGMGSGVSETDFKNPGKFMKSSAKYPAPGRTPPCGAGCANNSSFAMIMGNIYRPGGRLPPGQITGALSASDTVGKASIVDFGNMPPESAGFYGGAAGEWQAVGSAPYVNKRALAGPAGAISRGDNMYVSAMHYASDSVPVPERPKRSNSGKTGSVSSFDWKETYYQTHKSAAEKGLGSKSPVSQLADAFSVTNSAYESVNAEPEYQVGYTGAVYDGNDINLDILVNADEPLAGMADGFVTDLNNMQQLQKQVKTCGEAQAKNGTRMSEIGKEMDDIQSGMTNPPPCSMAAAWNRKVARLDQLCLEFNGNQSQLARACQSASGDQMGCEVYEKDIKDEGLRIGQCSSGFEFLLALILLPLTLAIAMLAKMRENLDAAKYLDHK